MIIKDLISILQEIQDNCGDYVTVEIFHDAKQSESLHNGQNGISIDDIKTVRLNEDNSKVYISNEFAYTETYNGYTCSAIYDSNSNKCKGIIIAEQIDNYDLSFEAENKYGISEAFHNAVDKYMKYLNEKSIIKTCKAINDILQQGEDIYEKTEKDDEYE